MMMVSAHRIFLKKNLCRFSNSHANRVLLVVLAVMVHATTASFSGTIPSAFVMRNKGQEVTSPKRRRGTMHRMQHSASDDNAETPSSFPSRKGFNGIPSPQKTNGFHMNPMDDFDSAPSHVGKNGVSQKNGATKNQGSKTNFPETVPNSQSLSPLSSHVVAQLPNGGRITLVGSGPGDPSLLTVAADRLLRDPNVVVIADRLVSDEIMDTLATSDVYVARKWPGCAEQAQEEIYHWTYQALLQGRHVVRLKIGDPFVFGRGAEEVLTFRKWGLEPKVIPGVSAALSAPLLGSIPVTHRGVANQLVICTGYGKEGTCPDLIRYHPEQTVVFLMAVGRLRELSQQLQHLAGYPSDMPIAIVERAACPNQRTIVGTLETIADVAEKYQAQAPSTIVVGRVVHVLLEQGRPVITAETAPAFTNTAATGQSLEWIQNCTTAFVN